MSDDELESFVFRHPLAERELVLGDVVVAYEFQRVSRRSIGMVISPEGLSVRAPKWVSAGDIETALQAKSRWIQKKLIEQRERAIKQEALRVDWRAGAVLPYLGQPFVLALDPLAKGVEVCADQIVLGLPSDAAQPLISATFQSWLKKQARHHFQHRVFDFSERMGVRVSKISLSSARTRWGSASADGSIRLHWRLMHFDEQVIDYVVVHELAHLKEMNHSPRFWAVVAAAMPHYEQARTRLRRALMPEWS